MKKRSVARRDTYAQIVFQKAAAPLEASVLPARERPQFGTLSMVPAAYEAPLRPKAQRAKIWVR